MRDINDFFEGESYPAGQFGADLLVVPLEDAKRIAVDYANQSKWITVNEALPEKAGFYLVNRNVLSSFTDENLNEVYENEVLILFYFKEPNVTGWPKDWTGKISNITHWQEVPPLPL